MASKPATSGRKVTNGNGGSNQLPYALAVMGILGGIVSFVWSQINPKTDIGAVELRLGDQVRQMESRQRDINVSFVKDIDEVKKNLDKFLMRDVHTEFASRKDKDTDRLRVDIDLINSDLVKRSEHQQHWNEQMERINAVRDQVLEIRRDLTSSASIGKQLDNIVAAQRADREAFQTQLLELQRRYEMRNPQVVAPNATIRAPN